MSDQIKSNEPIKSAETAIQKAEPKADTAIQKVEETASAEIQQARDIARRLKYMIVNGRKLADAEVWALAQYAAANKLNPFNGECYYLEAIGPAAGIAGWRKKAAEELEYEARIAKTPGAHYWLEYRKATREEANFTEGEDAAYVVILRDSISSARWRLALFEAARQLKDLGFKEPYDEAKKLVGPEPTWEGTGIVFADERFAREGRHEMYPRDERAKKRGEKQALRKRFPRIDLPEPDINGDIVDVEPQDFKMLLGTDESEPSTGEPKEPARTIDQNIEQLGFPEHA